MFKFIQGRRSRYLSKTPTSLIRDQ